MEIALLFSIFIVAMLAGVSVAPAMIVACIADVLIFGMPETLIAEMRPASEDVTPRAPHAKSFDPRGSEHRG